MTDIPDDLLEKHKAQPWPPLIVDGQMSAVVRWRDLILTILMWLLFALMLETEFELFFGTYLERWGFGDFNTEANWSIFFERLRPYLRVSIVLLCILLVASILTMIRRRRSLDLPPPTPLTVAEQAERAGMAERDLAAARELLNVVVTIDKDGRHTIRAR